MISVRGCRFFQNYTLSSDLSSIFFPQLKQVRLDEDGNIYDYSSLAQRGLSVNTKGQIYDVNTGRIVNNIDTNKFVIGRIS